jgi:hypothetical protein
MGLSLAVIVAICFMLPGAAFVAGFTRLYDASTPQSPLDQHLSLGLLAAVVVSIAAHGFAIALLRHYLGALESPELSVRQALGLLSGDAESVYASQALASIHRYPVRIAAYLTVLPVLCWLLGYLVNLAIEDHPASWYAILKPKDPMGLIDFMWITVELSLNGKCFLYAGPIKGFYLDKTGNLERVVFFRAARKAFDDRDGARKDYGDDEGWSDIEGESFVLQMKDSRTVSVDYIYKADFAVIEKDDPVIDFNQTG